MSRSPHSERRLSALSEYVGEASAAQPDGGTQIPPLLEPGARSLGLDAWEKSVLEQALSGGAGNGTHWCSLLLEGVALESKFRAETEQLDHGDALPEVVGRELRQRLVIDAAVGLALLEESQLAINAMILDGKVGHAKKLTHFRNKLGESVNKMGEKIGQQALTEARVMSRDMMPASSAEALPPRPSARNDEPTRSAAPSTRGDDAAASPSPAEERRRLLGVELRRLRHAGSAANPPLDANPGALKLRLDAWEKHAIDRAIQSQATDWSALVVEIVAFCARLADREAQQEGAASNLALAERITDAAIGLALMEELQDEINAMIASGKPDVAKHLSSLRNKLGQLIGPLRDELGGDAFKQAEQQSTLLTVPRHSRVETPAEDTPEETGPRHAYEPFKRDLASRARPYVSAEEQVSQVKSLSLVLVVLLAIWAVLVVPRLLREPIPEIQIAELPRSEAFVDALARPPSLYVTVDSREWKRMSRADRQVYVDAVGASVAPVGYTGVHFTSTSGTTVAQWLKKTGTRLVD